MHPYLTSMNSAFFRAAFRLAAIKKLVGNGMRISLLMVVCWLLELNMVQGQCPNYSYEKTITINQASGSSLIDFPVEIKIPTSAFVGHLQSVQGYDVIFTDLNYSPLDHQIEQELKGGPNDTLIVWVRIPKLKFDSITKIKMLYGKVGVIADPSVKTVWDSNFKCVWHLNLSDFNDQTANGNNGTNSNSTDISGIIGGAKYFNANAKITAPFNSMLEPLTNISVSLWFKRIGNQNDWAKLLWYGQNLNPQFGPYGLEFNFSADDDIGFHGANNSVMSNALTANVIADNTWYYAVGTYDGSNVNIFLNGNQISAQSLTSPLYYSGGLGLSIGDRNENGQAFKGYIDETRIATTTRSPDWILTEYRNQYSPTSFCQIDGTERNVPHANAGLDQDICGTLNGTLAGNNPSSGTGAWTQISGLGTITFTDATLYNTAISASLYGPGTLQWKITNGTCMISDTVKARFYESPLLLSAGTIPMEASCNQKQITLSATKHIYLGAPNVNYGKQGWSFVSGPGTASFDDTTKVNAVVTVTAYGEYILRWRESNGTCTISDTVKARFYESPINASAGADQFLCNVLNANLSGISHIYLPLPNQHISSTRLWSYVSGPDNTPTFGDATLPNSTVAVDLYGKYVFRWTETNGTCSKTSDVTIDFNEDPTGANAGPTQNICGSLTATFAGTAHSYQVGSEHNGSTRLWSYVSGPGSTRIFGDATSPTSTVSVDSYGTYVFRWTETNGTCSRTYDVTIWFEPTITISAFNDTLCNNGYTSIKPIRTSPNSPLYGGRYTWTADDPDNMIDGEMNSANNGYQLSQSIVQQLFNNDVNVHKIIYHIIPWTIKPDNSLHCQGTPIDLIVYVNPTPRINIAPISRDTICFNEGVTLHTTTPNKSVIGTMKYHLISTYIAGSISGVLSDGSYNIADTTQNLVNTTNDIQVITYKLTPFIENSKQAIPCENGISKYITYTLVPEIKYSLSDNSYIGGYNLHCYKDSIGSFININTLIGGRNVSTGYKYLWSNGITENNLVNPGTGSSKELTYTVSVSDSRIGCPILKSITLIQPDRLKVRIDSTKQSRCLYGGANGAIYVTTLGGAKPYKYNWTKNSGEFITNTKDVISIYSGAYNLTLKDTNNCQFDTLNVIVKSSPPPQMNFNSSSYGEFNISCHGANDGKFSPDFPYIEVVSYKWYFPNGDSTSIKDISNLGPGSYRLQIKDKVGCLWPFGDKLTEPDPIMFDKQILKYPNDFNVQCADDANGKISLSNPRGGHSKYQYVWNITDGPGLVQDDSTQNLLKAGVYHFEMRSPYKNNQITGESYCSVMDTFVLKEPLKLIVKDSIPKFNGFEVACNEAKTGTIKLDVSGGYGAFTYLWNSVNGHGLTQGNKDQINQLSAGAYNLTVTYGGGTCSETYNYGLNEPWKTTQDSTKSMFNGGLYNLACYGDSVGRLKVDVKSNLAFTYKWITMKGKGLDTATLDQKNLSAGEYSLIINDLNNCKITKTYTILQPLSLKVSINVIPISCNNQKDGTLTGIVSGGAGTYHYLWSDFNLSTTPSISDIPVGKYKLKVTDDDNCSVADTASLFAPSPLIIRFGVKWYHGYSVSCFNGNDGSIKLDVKGGKNPYNFTWTGPDNGSYLNSDSLSGLHAGVLTVQINDKNGCNGNASFTLTQPTSQPKVHLDTKVDLVCFGQPKGKISVSGSGGINSEPYTYRWSSGQNKPLIDNIFAGNYTVILTDLNNCTDSLNVVVAQPDSIHVISQINYPFCPSSEDGEIKLDVSGGTGSYKYNWSSIGGNSPSLINIKSATYIYHITDDNNCLYEDTLYLNPRYPICLTIPNAFSPNQDLSNDTWIIKAGDPRYEVELKEMYPKAIVEVFTRWGTLVYRSDPGYPTPWDGTYLGRTLPIDSYYFVISPKSGDTPMKGIVTIVR